MSCFALSKSDAGTTTLPLPPLVELSPDDEPPPPQATITVLHITTNNVFLNNIRNLSF